MKDKQVDEFVSERMFAATDPIALLNEWMSDAQTQEISDPNAMALATVDASGLPNVRIVLAKEINSRGIVFYTNFESLKGQELLQHGKAALCFYWKSLDRQVRIRGPVVPVSGVEADAYFATRDRESQIGAWASQQSKPIASRAALEAEVVKYEEQFSAMDVTRPEHWSGFRLLPTEMEFWHKRRFRLHDRLKFERPTSKDAWMTSRLFP
jgi:pyridoxamine 5'-phosphate oxidase